MTPSPPICISTSSTVLPKIVNCEPVSTTMSPVTHMPLVAVKRASMMPSGRPVDAAGSDSSIVPVMAAAR